MELPVKILFSISICQAIFQWSSCAPVNPKSRPNPDPAEGGSVDEPYLTGLEYDNYLREVVAVLEEDPTFRKELETANVTDIKSGGIAKYLERVHHSVREKLDEVKRKEISRLENYVRKKMKNAKGADHGVKKDFVDHIDVQDPHSFRTEDLKKLILKATADLDELDKQRKDEFKEYEVEKEYDRRKKLQEMDEQKRKEAEEQYEDQQKKHKDHPKLHHPGSKDQLEEVWEKKDHMDAEDFDPKTFFAMHDADSDGFLNPEEVEALFQSELDKVYDPNAPEDDMVERFEEMARMREHVVKELDQNKDKMISLAEFLKYTQQDEFKKDEGWDGIDDNKQYTEDDILNYEKRLKEHEEALLRQRVGPDGVMPGEINIPPKDPNVVQMNMPPGGQVQGHHPGMGAQPLHQQQQQNLQFKPHQQNQPNQQQFQQPNQQQFQQPNQQQFQQPNQQQFQQPNQQQGNQPVHNQQVNQQNVQQQQINVNAQQQQNQQQHQQQQQQQQQHQQQQGLPQQNKPPQDNRPPVPAV